MASGIVPAVQCRATAKGTGRQCRRMSLRGAAVCISHGARAPQVRRKAAERVAIAEQQAATPRRHPASILLDAMHTADVLARQGGAEALQALETAARLARLCLELDLDKRMRLMLDDEVKAWEQISRKASAQAGLSHAQEQAFRAAMADGLRQHAARQEGKVPVELTIADLDEIIDRERERLELESGG